jgi:uncharacterized phage protein (TIGR02218 family)
VKTANATLTALILSGQFLDFDCYTFTLASGTVLRYTAADFDIGDGANTWSGRTVLTDDANAKPTAHWKVGLDVDTWAVTLMPRARDPFTGANWPDTINGMPFLAAAAAGAFDGAQVLVQRAYFAAPPTQPIAAAGAPASGFLTVFFGLVGEYDIVSSRAVLTLLDMRHLLTVNMPRAVYQAPCPNILFDARCTLSAAAYVRAGSAQAGSTTGKINCSILAPAGSGTYTLGRIRFTTGQNAGIARTISSWDGVSSLVLRSALPFPPTVGDAFSVYPGCDKSLASCVAFGNRVNFRGTPFTPVPEVTV